MSKGFFAGGLCSGGFCPDTTFDIITRLYDNAAFVCVHVVGRFSEDFSEVHGLRSRGFHEASG